MIQMCTSHVALSPFGLFDNSGFMAYKGLLLLYQVKRKQSIKSAKLSKRKREKEEKEGT